ncbi:acid-sensing ion channel 1-like [Galendromus occidentalis]|uniref:Acid-sensing ion channel 1-like n=1 Tax=Galendromus occidentalis TaxID=34638 RepID=A0AAJ6VWI1_9ACAR|nr:acid-sensing ion channel 1-like [Galendromus occidentalis]
MYRFNEVDPDELPKMTHDEIARELQAEDAALRNKYKGASQAVYYARRLSIYHEEKKPLQKLLVNSDTALGSVYRPETTARRLYFFAIYLAMLGLSIYMSYGLVVGYFARESVFQINAIEPFNITLPAITICNKNPIRKIPLCDRRDSVIAKWNLSAIEREGLEDLCGAKRSQLTPKNFRQMIPAMVEYDFLHEFGHDIADSLRGCLVQGRPCPAAYFTEVIDMEAGRCWCIFCNHTFDIQNGVNTLKVFNMTMFRRGLIMLLDVEPEQLIDEISDGVGFLLKLHTPGEGAHPMFGSVNLPVNQTTYVAIKAKRIERQPGSQPDMCLSEFPESMDYADRREQYEPHACTEACTQKIISEVCECIVADLYNLTTGMPKACPAMPPATNDSKSRCDPSELIRDPQLRKFYDVEKCGYICSTKMQSSPSEFFDKCADLCRPQCEEMQYRLSTSRSRWLSGLKSFHDADFLLANRATGLVKVFVYFEQIEMEYFAGTWKMTYVEALVEVGGQMGTYLGLTVLIAFEICELIVRYLLILYRRKQVNAVKARDDLSLSETAFLQKSIKANRMEAAELERERKLLTNRLLSARRPVAFQRFHGRA